MTIRKITGLCVAIAAMSPLLAFGQEVKVTFQTPQIAHIQKVAEGQVKDLKSEVIIAQPEQVKVQVRKGKKETAYKTGSLTVLVDNQTQAVTFLSADGKTLLREGSMDISPIGTGVDKGHYTVRQEFMLDPDEPIYGLGALQNGKMSQRGENRLMIQSNLEDYSNIFQSVKGYGVYWENYSPTRVEDNGKMLSLSSEVGEQVDYWFMWGKSADGVIAQFRHLSGKVPMLPRWTYGFHQSRERYKSQNELLEVVSEYRKRHIPLDGIIQDWQYWGNNYLWNSMEFLNEDYPAPQAMVDSVHGMNAHMSISIWSSFGPQTKPYRELASKGHLLDFLTWPNSGVAFWPPLMDYPSGVKCYSPYSDEARNIYWKYLRNLHNYGIDAWWMDSTDPDHNDIKESDYDQMTEMGSYRSVRNIFPLRCVEGVFSNQRREDASKRVFILTRSYFAGQQRTGANMWTGDTGCSWENLRKQVPICLNYTLTANPNVNTDISGFFANSYNRGDKDNTACKNPLFQELYVRWMQFGLFCPMMRSHGCETFREVYYYGDNGDPVYEALVSQIRMRYRLLPYIYSTSWQVSQNDDSFMRALVMDFSKDRNTWDLGNEFMFGRSFLVAPVLHALYTPEEKTADNSSLAWYKDKKYIDGYKADWTASKQMEVYLPAGTDWYDFWTGERIQGGKKVMADASLSKCPLYVKAGSIVPTGPDEEYHNEKSLEKLDLTVYPGGNGEFTLYEDEGDGYNYEKGMYTTITFKYDSKKDILAIGKREGSYPGMLKARTFVIRKAGSEEKTVSYSGNAMSISLK